MSPASLPTSYFDGVYATSADPWNFESSDYERAKYARTLAALPKAHYQRGFEIGCSIGVLTRQLALRCATLLAVDVSAEALAAARARCAGVGEIEFAAMSVPAQLPERRFDLVMLSEVGYYWSREDLGRVSSWIVGHLEPGGSLMLVHWTPIVADYPLRGDDVHEHFLALARAGLLRHVRAERHATYRLDAFSAACAWPARCGCCRAARGRRATSAPHSPPSRPSAASANRPAPRP